MITLLAIFFIGYRSGEIKGIGNLFDLRVSQNVSKHYFVSMGAIGKTIKKVSENDLHLAMA